MLVKKRKKRKEKQITKKFNLKRKASAILTFVMTIGMLSGACMGDIKQVEAAGGTAADVVSIAASQVGYYEKASNAYLDDFTANRGANNYNKYARDVGVTNGQPWCATFVWWCMQAAGVPYANYPSRTTVTRDWFVQRGQYHARGTYVPKPGDYVVFGNVEHCGIVESVSGNYVTTIEGNSSNQVKRNTYALTNSYILGYGTINYNGPSPGPVVNDNPGQPYPIPTTNIKNGSRGDQVCWVQKFANDVMGSGLEIDGIAGSKTVYAIKQFQSWYGLTVDGIAGTQTVNKMLAVWREKVTPVNLGDNFCALIIRTDIWKTIRNVDDNVVLWDEAARGDYLWNFTRQSDGSYRIESLYDGTVLDAQAAGTANSTNVITWADGNGSNQRWYIYPSGNAYKLVPKHASGMCLDVTGACEGNGTNIQIYENNGSAAQIFSIYKCDHQALKSIAITAAEQSMYIGDSQTLEYTLSPSNTKSNMVKWESSNTSVATVDSNGQVTAKAEGTAVIKCVSTYNKNIYGSVTITVNRIPEPATEQPIEEPTVEPATEQPTEEPTVEPATEQPTEEPIVEPATEQPIEEPTVEPATEQPIEEPTVEPATEQPIEESTVEPATGQPTVEPDAEWVVETEDDYSSKVKPEGERFKAVNGKQIYEVTNSSIDSPEVAFVKHKNAKCVKIVIPDTVTKNGVTYKVTSVKDNAATNNKKLTSVTFGRNIRKIGKAAFKGCKKLKYVTFKGVELTSVGKNAFQNTAKKKIVSAPKSKLSEYNAMVSKSGAK